jgi:glutamate-1-semialdehyde 2,1-aminomutase
MWVSGQGSMLCIHFEGPSQNSLKALFWHHMLEHGIYMAQRGFVALNLELRDEDIDKFLDAARSFVANWKKTLFSL